jgi:hypothetical protein
LNKRSNEKKNDNESAKINNIIEDNPEKNDECLVSPPK